MLQCVCGDPLAAHRLEAGEKRGEIDVRECTVPGCSCERYELQRKECVG